ncbi:DUF3500 domain-containing protein [Devosia sp. Root635]|uniref:DUF3500 domain-containing protein n=1 Tax=Devosia sp. Root635 TaxID=1736575 RepID=UPI0006FFE864|nr:DUF3500 domain-containing protein [Devosia sp. Root635]KRA47212.1 hypothetical protein ASD80_18000 [Devosia sp. Root635]
MSSNDFRDYLLPADSPRILNARGLDPITYSRPILATDRAIALNAEWQGRYSEPFKGVTAGGELVENLFALEDEGFDPAPAVAAMQSMLGTLSGVQRTKLSHAVDANEWRGWYNPEIVFNDHGVRLEDMPETARAAFLDLLAACTSTVGFTKIRQLLSANLYLGELYDLRNIMNEWSFHFLMFGTPSTGEPWGWSIYGHHVGFNCFILGRQMVISPTFMGVEPNVIDRGNGDRFVLFTEEERLGLNLMQSLTAEQKARSTIYEQMVDPAMPPGRFNFADQRHLGGAFQDNRIIPLEGIRASEMTPEQQQQLLALVETFIEHLPDGPRAAQMRRIERHLAETWWSWIGGHGDEDPFYFRIQSPVVMLEFDHHDGMWLTNDQPAKFHIHVISRIPNGNDYGRALLKLWRDAKAP